MSDKTYTSENIIRSIVPSYLKKKCPTGMSFLDNLLGGGFVPSITYMLSGDPGAGKTTLVTQASDALTMHGNIVLFNSVEQPKDQVASMVDRFGLASGFIFSTHKDYRDVMLHAHDLKEANPNKQVVIVIDSITSMSNGSRAVAQEISDAFINYCQMTKAIGIFLVHTTKGGKFAGNNTMKHHMDAHIHITVNDPTNDDGTRVIHTEKNRFAKRASEDMLLTDVGLIPLDKLTPTDLAAPVYLGDEDYEVVELNKAKIRF